MRQMVQKDIIKMVVDEAKEITHVKWMMKVPCETHDNIRIVIDLIAGRDYFNFDKN